MILRPVRPASACGPPELELAGRIGEHLVAVGGEISRYERADHVIPQVGQEQRLHVDIRIVLGGDQHRAQPDGTAVLVLEGDLGLTIRAQVGQHARLAHLGQALGQPVGEPDRHRHQVVGLVARVAEHHSLVARTLSIEDVLAAGSRADLQGGVDALGDVRATGRRSRWTPRTCGRRSPSASWCSRCRSPPRAPAWGSPRTRWW